MNGIHDMGGMHGFGALEDLDDDAIFHDEWEGRVFAMGMAMQAVGGGGFDVGRSQIENAEPSRYLESKYFERWLEGFFRLFALTGMFSPEEIAQLERGEIPAELADVTPPDAAAITAETTLAYTQSGAPTLRASDAAPAFAVGDRVTARNLNPAGHTRLPRYVRGRTGTITAHHGAHVFPDSVAAHIGEDPEHLYTVSFAAQELWGPDASAKDTVRLELWEPYLGRPGEI